VFASLIAFAKAFWGLDDFRNLDVPFRVSAPAELIMCSIALAALGMGVRFLRFAWTGRSDPSSSWLRTVLLGIGFFFPGFVFSLPLTALWARHRWPCDGQNYFGALDASFCVGVVAAIICFVALLKKRNVRHT